MSGHGADKFYGDGQGGRNAREIALGKWKDRLEAENKELEVALDEARRIYDEEIDENQALKEQNKELRNQVTLLEAGQEMRDFRIEQLTTRVSLLTGENESLTARALSDASILANYRIFYNEETGECT